MHLNQVQNKVLGVTIMPEKKFVIYDTLFLGKFLDPFLFALCGSNLNLHIMRPRHKILDTHTHEWTLTWKLTWVVGVMAIFNSSYRNCLVQHIFYASIATRCLCPNIIPSTCTLGLPHHLWDNGRVVERVRLKYGLPPMGRWPKSAHGHRWAHMSFPLPVVYELG